VQELPHHYRVEASLLPAGDVALRASGLPDLASQPPAEFGGPGDRWSPETLLLAAVADCYALSFRVLAANSKLGFRELTCRAQGTIDRADGRIRFTGIALAVEVSLAADASPERAQRLLERAKDVCIVSNSLSVPVTLDARIADAAG
jgi:organic hydroperoxide reductase OsmC/OhrA